MCGRFTLTIIDLGSVAETLQAIASPELGARYRPRYNIAPGSEHWVVRLENRRRLLEPASWGLASRWAGGPRPINARAETVTQRATFREAFHHRRCVVPADGFYEWHGPPSARQPVWFHAPDHGLLLFAGLYQQAADPRTGEITTSFAILTTAANEDVAPIHGRMPALLGLGSLELWLMGPDPRALLRPAPARAVLGQPASRKVSSGRLDGPELLVTEPSATGTDRQLGLF